MKRWQSQAAALCGLGLWALVAAGAVRGQTVPGAPPGAVAAEKELKTEARPVDKTFDRTLPDDKAGLTARRAGKLARMYERMEPAKAAALVAGLDDDLAVAVLARMRSRAAGRVLGAMEKERALRLSAAYGSADRE